MNEEYATNNSFSHRLLQIRHHCKCLMWFGRRTLEDSNKERLRAIRRNSQKSVKIGETSSHFPKKEDLALTCLSSRTYIHYLVPKDWNQISFKYFNMKMQFSLCSVVQPTLNLCLPLIDHALLLQGQSIPFCLSIHLSIHLNTYHED